MALTNVNEYYDDIMNDVSQNNVSSNTQLTITIDPADVNIIALCDKINSSGIIEVRGVSRDENMVIFDVVGV